MSSSTLAPYPPKNKTISPSNPTPKNLTNSLVARGMETWRGVKNKCNQATIKFSRNKPNIKQDVSNHTDRPIVYDFSPESSEIREISNKTVKYDPNANIGFISTDFEWLKDFSDSFDKSLDNTENTRMNNNDKYFDKSTTPILKLPDLNNESLFSSLGSDMMQFLNASFDDILISEKQTFKKDNFVQNLKPHSISKSNSQNSTQEGPTGLTTSLSSTTISSSASTKNDEKSNKNSLNKHEFEQVINDSNANLYSFLAFAKSDVKRKDYRNALKSLRYVIENMRVLDPKDRQILGTKVMVLLEKCANSNTDSAIYIA
jgi:hypothetical protein